MRCAAIGIGSNSIRMLIADIENGNAAAILRERKSTRLFAGLDDKNCLSAESMALTVETVEKMYHDALARGACEVSVFATSAVRDAGNRDELKQMLLSRTGMLLDVISGDCEALLSFIGATDGTYTGVIDIGGGSTEIAMGEGSCIQDSFSLQMGAVRLQRQQEITTAAQVEQAVALVTEILAPHVDALSVTSPPSRWFGVGGTLTTLASIIHGIAWTGMSEAHALTITAQAVADTACRLADMSLSERSDVVGMRPQRADIIVQGSAILLAVMRRMAIETLTVSENGNLDGFIMQKYHARFI